MPNQTDGSLTCLIAPSCKLKFYLILPLVNQGKCGLVIKKLGAIEGLGFES